MVNVMLEDLTHRCFLSRDMNGVKACIDTIMQCTLDFRAHLSTASQEGDSNSSNLINDNLFVKVLDVKYTFEASLRKLYAFHRRPEPQYRILLSEFWMCLNFNGFVAHTCSQALPSWPLIQTQLSNQNLATWFKIPWRLHSIKHHKGHGFALVSKLHFSNFRLRWIVIAHCF